MKTKNETKPSIDCIFCNNIEHKVIETENFYIKVGKSIVTEGHVMVITKQHVGAIAAINDNLAEEYINLKNKLVKFLTDNYYEPFMVEHGNFMQSVFHAHIHFIPRKGEDYEEFSIFDNMLMPFLENHKNVKYINIDKFEDLLDLYRKDGKYLYFEEGNRRLAIRASLLSDEDIEIVKEAINYRMYFANTTNRKYLQSWRDMTEKDVEFDEKLIANTKETFRSKWL